MRLVVLGVWVFGREIQSVLVLELMRRKGIGRNAGVSKSHLGRGGLWRLIRGHGAALRLSIVTIHREVDEF